MNIQITTIVQEEAKGWGERRNKGDIYNVTHEMQQRMIDHNHMKNTTQEHENMVNK